MHGCFPPPRSAFLSEIWIRFDSDPSAVSEPVRTPLVQSSDPNVSKGRYQGDVAEEIGEKISFPCWVRHLLQRIRELLKINRRTEMESSSMFNSLVAERVFFLHLKDVRASDVKTNVIHYHTPFGIHRWCSIQ